MTHLNSGPALTRVQARHQDRVAVARTFQARLDKATLARLDAPPPVPRLHAVGFALGLPAGAAVATYFLVGRGVPFLAALGYVLVMTALLAAKLNPWSTHAAAERAEAKAYREVSNAHPEERAIWATVGSAESRPVPTRLGSA